MKKMLMIVAALGLILAGSGHASATVLWGCGNPDWGTGSSGPSPVIFRFDTSTGVISATFDFTGSNWMWISGVADSGQYLYVSHNLYDIDTGSYLDQYEMKLAKVNRTTGAVLSDTSITGFLGQTYSQVNALEFHDGKLYGVENATSGSAIRGYAMEIALDANGDVSGATPGAYVGPYPDCGLDYHDGLWWATSWGYTPTHKEGSLVFTSPDIMHTAFTQVGTGNTAVEGIGMIDGWEYDGCGNLFAVTWYDVPASSTAVYRINTSTWTATPLYDLASQLPDSIIALGGLSNLPSPSKIWVDDDYCDGCPNGGHIWCYDAFDGIQYGINAVATGGTINVYPGTYDQDEANGYNAVTGGPGSSNFNIFVNKSVTIQGVDSSGAPITDYEDVEAFVVPKRNTPSGNLSTFFIQADDVTISGLDITAYDDPDYNFKTISVIGENATIKNCNLHNRDQVSCIYMYDPRYSAGNNTSHITSYRFEGNYLDAGGIYAAGVRISSGPGWTGSAANRVITGNYFQDGSYGIQFVGPGADPWDVNPVGAATISGNSFNNADKGHVVAWGAYSGGEGYGALDWDGIFTGNTFDRAVITKRPGGAVQYYDSGNFKYVRGIYSAIKRYPVNVVSQAGDTIIVSPGTYNETGISITKSLIITGRIGDCPGPAPDAPILDGGGANANGFDIAAGIDNVTIEGFFIRNFGTSPTSPGWGIGVRAYGTSADPTTNITVRYNQFDSNIWASVLFFNEGQSIFDAIDVNCNIVNIGPWSSNTNVYGIECTNCSNSNISDNEVSGGYDGIVMTAQAQAGRTVTAGTNSISSNTVSNSVDANIFILPWLVSGGGPAPTLQDISVLGNRLTNANKALTIVQYTGVLKNFTITGNELTVTGPVANNFMVDLADVAGASTFSDNTVVLSGASPSSFFHGLNLGGAATGNWTIKSNVFEGNSVGPNSVAMRLRGTLPAGSALDINCNRIEGWKNGIQSDALANAGLVKVYDNSIAGNSANGFLDGGSSAAIDAEDNWWGCTGGPGNSGCNAVSGNLDFTPWATSVPPCVSCGEDADCDDGLVCNGAEICHLEVCQAGVPVDCSHLTAQCNIGVCEEPGHCIAEPLPDGSICDDGDTCSIPDRCQAGVCIAGGGGDTDEDTICDADDICPKDPNNDIDNDGVCGDIDNCPSTPNGPARGTCISGANMGAVCSIGGYNPMECGESGPYPYCSANQEDTNYDGVGNACDFDGDGIPNDVDNCPSTPNTGQTDSYPPGGNNCGDACECEGNFDGDDDQDGTDAVTFKKNFGRNQLLEPCTNINPCKGDFTCDGDVDGSDAHLFKTDFGRGRYSNPCPNCLTIPWCSY